MVVDASVIIALLRNEEGADEAAELIQGASICTVNVSEIADHLARSGWDRATIGRTLGSLGIRVVPADLELALNAAMLRPMTDAVGLSLGDRFCLALAQQRGCIALTADRAWLRISEVSGIAVQLIR